MTNDQNIEFLAQLEIDLKNRYTEQDEEFMRCFNAPMPDPPILKIVFRKPRYQNDKSNWHSNNHSNNYKDNNYSYRNNRNNSHHYSPFKKNNDNHNRHSYNNNNNRPNHN